MEETTKTEEKTGGGGRVMFSYGSCLFFNAVLKCLGFERSYNSPTLVKNNNDSINKSSEVTPNSTTTTTRDLDPILTLEDVPSAPTVSIGSGGQIN